MVGKGRKNVTYYLNGSLISRKSDAKQNTKMRVKKLVLKRFIYEKNSKEKSFAIIGGVDRYLALSNKT